MSEETPKELRIYLPQFMDHLKLGDTVKYEKIESQKTEWEKRLSTVKEIIDPYQYTALKLCIKLLRANNKKPLTQDGLMEIASGLPNVELSEGAMKKALAQAVRGGVLINIRAGKSTGYRLPEWDWK